MESPLANSENHLDYHQTPETVIEMEPTSSNSNELESIIELEQKPYKITEKKPDENHYESLTNNKSDSEPKEEELEKKAAKSHLEEEFYTVRRIIFFFYLIIFAIFVPFCLF